MMGLTPSNGHCLPCNECPLRDQPALRDFDEQELAFVKTLKTDEIHVPAGATFLQQGQRSEQLYTLLTGWAFRYKMLDDGRRQILNFALPADLLGLQGSLMEEMEHSIEALTDLRLCVFPRSKLWALYSNVPSLAFDITWLAARSEQLLDENLLSVGQRTALERTAYVLLALFTRAEEVGLTKGNTIVFPFNQQHLADTLGMSLVHTNKTLKRLYAANAVRWKDRTFEILDRAAVTQIAAGEIVARRRRPFI
jgi:CRP/FNR family transcriptional regulator